MEKSLTSSEEQVRLCLKKFQLEDDRESFNYLLEKYYKTSCMYATKYLNSVVYSNLISYTLGEVESYVFLAFWKAAKNYRCEGNSLSFKNYLYQTIKYESIAEIKSTFKWGCIPKAEQKWVKEQEMLRENDPSAYCESLELKEKSFIIFKFLESKKPIYSLIWDLKAKDLRNSEICAQLGISEIELKSRWQYIKKLIQGRYSCLDDVC
ncbi:RNA polymerase sigma factor RpoE [Candidatus Mycoplasma haematolamae str. Purdue]|uniref:RNA polymerase sigma factor RpoE n=1 Tax=Mycoplasma haematolamae (strain Purdue) TaxID=1212765 RepID=I7BAH7_MYCHA|nr:sigma-70 family RNA polymerase sigma factor [Candidatus Mycoplasma haematolamae]AFO52305.1 RNA polymerase sigma factor RpoE [Candidatus Mycoplasma haematolamae str. Purdue]